MSNEDLYKALFGFLLGLAAKFIYDIWQERRRRKSLVFSKTIISSFLVKSLEEQLREQTKVLFRGYDVSSIHLVKLGLKNVGYAAVRGQAFSVQFGEKATIIGEPKIEGTFEDKLFIRPLSRTQTNVTRFGVNLIQKGSKVDFEFAVINHDQPNFEIGFAPMSKDGKPLDDSDLDVNYSITGEKIGADFIQMATRFVGIALLIPVMYLMRSFLAGVDGTLFTLSYASLWNVIIAIFWLILLFYAYHLVPQLFEWLNSRSAFGMGGDHIGGDKISIGDISGSSAAIGREAAVTMQTIQPQTVDEAEVKRIDELFTALMGVAENSTNAQEKIQLLEYEIRNLQDADEGRVAGLIMDIYDQLPETSPLLAALGDLPSVKRFGGATTNYVLSRVTNQ